MGLCTPWIDSSVGRITVHTTGAYPTGADTYEGKHIWDSTSNSLMVCTDPATATWEIVHEPTQSWTSVTVTQSATVTGTIATSWYQRGRDKTFQASLKWTASSAGTAANAIVISTPLTLGNIDYVRGTAHVLDNGTTHYVAAIQQLSTTTMNLVVSGNAGFLGVAPAFTLASTDVIQLELTGRYA